QALAFVQILSIFRKSHHRFEFQQLKNTTSQSYEVGKWDQTIKARIWLAKNEEGWKVKRSFVRERLRGRKGRRGRRFCLSF
ncbi:MAG: hypothetical protein AAF399_22500, partial [Bacteroidota bacterium]